MRNSHHTLTTIALVSNLCRQVYFCSNYFFSVPRLGFFLDEAQKTHKFVLVLFHLKFFAMATSKKSVMSFKNLQFYLNSDKSHRGTNAGMGSTAQTATLLQLDNQDILPMIERANELLVSNTLPRVLLAVIELQLFYGLRISECLNITTSDVSSTGHIRVRGSKGSNDRIVIPYRFSSFWQNEAKALLPLVNVYSRFWFYRQYKSLGLYAIFGNSRVHSVTHLFRHLNILSLKENFNETDLTRKFIGHKSIKSTMHYERKKKL